MLAIVPWLDMEYIFKINGLFYFTRPPPRLFHVEGKVPETVLVDLQTRTSTHGSHELWILSFSNSFRK